MDTRRAVHIDVPAEHQCFFCSNSFLVCMNLVNLVKCTVNVYIPDELCAGKGFKKGVLFARRVRICEELYSGRMDFSSFTNRASKLDKIAGELCDLCGTRGGTAAYKSFVAIFVGSCSNSARAACGDHRLS